MSLDPAPGTDTPAGAVRLFIDGALARTVPLQKSPALSCPGLGTEAETSPPVALHLQGDNGTRTGDLVYLATPLSGLFGIDRMDPSGAGRAAVVRPSDGTVNDPDYSPLVDKLVYSSNQSGNAEIWLSNGDGSNPQQLTTGLATRSTPSSPVDRAGRPTPRPSCSRATRSPRTATTLSASITCITSRTPQRRGLRRRR